MYICWEMRDVLLQFNSRVYKYISLSTLKIRFWLQQNSIQPEIYEFQSIPVFWLSITQFLFEQQGMIVSWNLKCK